MPKQKNYSMLTLKTYSIDLHNMMVFMNFKLLKQHCSFLILFLINCTIYADDTTFDFDSFDLLETENISTKTTADDFDDLISGITPEELSLIRSCPAGDANLWLLVFAQFNLVSVLNAPFYKATSIPITRNLIHFPAMEICSYPDLSNRQFTGHILFTKTSEKAFRTSTEDEIGTRIGSYLNIENRTLLNVIEEILTSPSAPESLREKLQQIDFRALTRALGNAHLEERRFAFMGHYYQEMGRDFYFEAKMPLVWMIKNLNFKQKDKDTIQQQLSIYQGGNFDENAFADKHLIMDAIGTGTLELSLCKKVWEHSNYSVDFGGGLLLPTDYAFKCGMRGSCFKPIENPPHLSFCQLADLATQTANPGGLEAFTNYFLCALDQFSSIVLQCPLGYNHHLGVEFKLAPFWQVKPNLEFNGLYILELFLPKEQQRFYVPQDQEVFSELYNQLPQSTNAEQDAKLAFVEARITELFFPIVLTTKMYPGFIFTSISSLRKAYHSWDFIAGYNAWYKSGEKIVSFPNTSATQLKALNLDYHKSVNPDVFSIKLFGKIHKTIHTRRHDDISLSVWADATIFNSGIGNDFSLGLCFDSKF